MNEKIIIVLERLGLEDTISKVKRRVKYANNNKKIFFLTFFIISLVFLGFFVYNNIERIPKTLELHYIDIGQGDCALVRTPSNKNFLIDSGPNKSEDILRRYLKQNKIKNFDIVLGTHYDEDHIGNTDFIIENYNCKNLILPKCSGSGSDFQNMITRAKSKNVKVHGVMSGDSFKLDEDTQIMVVSPSIITDDTNKNSIVFILYYKGGKFLFTGDCDSENESEILRNYDLPKIDILKVAHHGSKTSTTDEFIDKIRPTAAVISCGYKNRFGHPKQETLDTLNKYSVKIFRTDMDSNIVFTYDGKDLKLKR